VLVAAAVVAVLGLGALGFAVSTRSSETPAISPPPGLPMVLDAVTWTNGSCVMRSASGLVPVPCTSPNDGRVVASAASQKTCPSPATNAFVADTPRGWCVDLVS